MVLECVRESQRMMASEACAVFPAWVMYVARDLRVPCLYRISLISVFEGSFGFDHRMCVLKGLEQSVVVGLNLA